MAKTTKEPEKPDRVFFAESRVKLFKLEYDDLLDCIGLHEKFIDEVDRVKRIDFSDIKHSPDDNKIKSLLRSYEYMVKYVYQLNDDNRRDMLINTYHRESMFRKHWWNRLIFMLLIK
jgi:hypothetical protein